MNYKVMEEGLQLSVKIELCGSAMIDPVKLNYLSRGMVRGFLKARKFQNNKIIEYIGPVMIPLYERLKKAISVETLFSIVRQISDATINLQNHGLPWNSIIWDIHRIYINETTEEIQLIYLPLKVADDICNALGVLEHIVSLAESKDEDEKKKISDFLAFIKQQQFYEPNEMKAYITQSVELKIQQNKTIEKSDKAILAKPKKEERELYDSTVSEKKMPSDSTDNKAAIASPKEELQETMMLNHDGRANSSAVKGEAMEHCPTLIRALTEEHISVNKPMFRLGRERSSVDYCITNNNSVSREHTDIIIRGARYYVKDLNSRNHTYINNQRLPAQRECEIFDKDQLTLGNENFTFHKW